MTVGELIKALSSTESPLGEIPDIMNLEVKVSLPGKVADKTLEVKYVNVMWESGPGPHVLDENRTDFTLKAKKLIVVE